MKCVYDIVLNFNDKFYDFFLWDNIDNLDYIKRIPILKVSNNVISDLKNNKVKLNNLPNIECCTEIYTKNSISYIDYALLFVSDDDVVGIEFNKKGINIYKSDLLMDEALDIIEVGKKMKTCDIKYDIISRDEDLFLTREEYKMLNFINRELIDIYNTKNIDKLKYLYFECFNTITDIDKMYKELYEYVLDSPKKIYDILMISYKGLQK